MADNEFLNGVRIEQFIKSSNEQITDSISTLDKNFTTNVKSILTNQKTQITSLKSIDKTTKSLDKNMSKLLVNQDKLLKELTKAKKSSNDSAINELVKKIKPKDEKKDTFKREDYDKENSNLLEKMNKSLGIMANKKDVKSSSFLKSLLFGMGGLLAGGGLIGWILTGKKEGLQAMGKGIFKMFGSTGKIAKGMLTMVTHFGDIIKGVGRLKKLFARVGLNKGLKLLGGRAMGKGFAKGAGKTTLKNIPGIGSILNLIFAVQKFKKGDVVGGLLELGSFAADLIPGIGPAIGLALDLYSLKRDLTISDSDLQTEKEIFTHPIKAVRTLWSGHKNKKATKRMEQDKPILDAATNKLKTLSKEERLAFSDYKQGKVTKSVGEEGYEQQYADTVDAYFKSLGKGGGGFQFSDDVLFNKSGSKAMKSTYTKTSKSEKDDNHTKPTNKVAAAISRAWARIKSKNHVKLNPAENVSLMGMNPTMMRNFYRLSKAYSEYSGGGKIMINSAKRPGTGSVHNVGYAIDANALDSQGRRFGDGYIPDHLLQRFGFHKPLLKYKTLYGGPQDEAWHIEPYPGEDIYGGPRNTLAPEQPYRKGVLLAGGNGYAAKSETGGGGFDVNLPQGKVPPKSQKTAPINVVLTDEDINKLATAFGTQMKKNIKTPENVVMDVNNANPRSL